jgi:outer membrane protein OmpA-like peptidoglycan-associated protein
MQSIAYLPLSRRTFVLGSALASILAAGPLRLDLAYAADTADEEAMLQALLSRKGGSRIKRSGPSTNASADAQAIERFKQIRHKRGLNLQERDELYERTRDKPQLDLTVFFAFDSADLSPPAMAVLDKLGRVLKRDVFAGRTFVIAGHTDAKGGTDYNQKLSERRAEAVRRYLVEQFEINEDLLLPVGYGFEQLKNPKNPYADENRRVEVVNFTKQGQS